MRKQALRAHHLHADIQDLVYIYIPDGFPGAGEVALLVKGKNWIQSLSYRTLPVSLHWRRWRMFSSSLR
jgi:hypothetical protein